MKKPLATLTLAGLIASTIATTGAFAADHGFTDIEGSFAKKQIIELVEKGIIKGIDADTFDPKGQLTRAQFVTLIVRALELPIEDVETDFTDVEGWALPYIEAALNAGIIIGNGNGTFDPNAPLTREAAIVMMVRALQAQSDIELEDASALDFTDSDSISDWAAAYVATAKKLGLISGNPDGLFNPQGTANREQAAVMMVNVIKVYEEITSEPTEPTETPEPTPTPTPPVTGGGGGGYIPPASDTTAPSVPQFESFNPGYNSVIVRWLPSTDNVGVTGYEVYKDDEKIATVSGTEYNLTGLAPSTYYKITIKARDAAGNVSNVSPPTHLRTAAYATNAEELTALLAEGDNFDIILADGEYTGQFIIDGHVSIKGEGDAAIIKAPETAVAPIEGFVNHNGASIRPLIYVAPGAGAIIRGITIDGAHSEDVNHPEVITGVGVQSAEHVRLINVTIKGMIDPDPNHLGIQNGYGVYAANADLRDSTVIIENSNIREFQKNGVFFNGNIEGAVNDNMITGFEAHPHNAQNGIVFYNGAYGSIQRNILSGFHYTGTANAVATPILVLTDGEVVVSDNNVLIPNPEDFVATEDFSFTTDIDGNGTAAYNVGFKLNTNAIDYANITEIKVFLIDAVGNVLATRTATGAQIAKLAADDVEYGGKDGQLSAAFKERTAVDANEWWTSSTYAFTEPAKAVITIKLKNDSVFTVENTNLVK
ncbi:S-layer homology domain-containing protein [Paenibacillus agaridevorans]|uniref:S-layer homology domain-containing protein n=1 Tax=Paenibacillus agaridevorans TaxID=171404 RepID=UPI001BE4808A|nr:S-layer homology domain-containing protein [Paenibacillus agaridevorans]